MGRTLGNHFIDPTNIPILDSNLGKNIDISVMHKKNIDISKLL